MDLAAVDPHTLDLFLQVYGTLPRAGPGGTAHTLRALELVPGPAVRRVLDLGCGPGAQTVALAGALPEAEICAIDILPHMVARATRRVEAASLGDRVRVAVGDMESPPVPHQSQDLIWCEGAIYFLGVAEALRTWRPLLAPGGAIAFTQLIWLWPDPPQEVREYLSEECPWLTDEAGTIAAIESADFASIGSFVLPPEAWRDEYYEPMAERIAALRARHPDDPVAEETAVGAEREIEIHRRYAECYSYGFFIARPAGS